MHRDVKPGNILVEHGADDESEPDHIYLTDSGLSKHAASRSGLTATGEFMGTIDYIAPEQIQGRPVDGRADIYSLGCVLYECLTGRVPFAKDINAAVIWAHVEEMPTAPSSAAAHPAAQIDHALAKALAKDPADRYATCREFVAAARARYRRPRRHHTGTVPHSATDPGQPSRCRRARQPFTRRPAASAASAAAAPPDRDATRRCRAVSRRPPPAHPRSTPGLRRPARRRGPSARHPAAAPPAGPPPGGKPRDARLEAGRAGRILAA